MPERQLVDARGAACPGPLMELIATIKLVEIGALVVDAVLIIEEGFAVACPVASLLTVILVSLNKERFLSKYQHDLARVLSGKKNG